MKAEPFLINVDQAVLGDLERMLRRTHAFFRPLRGN